jgi:hypothetical protein
MRNRTRRLVPGTGGPLKEPSAVPHTAPSRGIGITPDAGTPR